MSTQQFAERGFRAAVVRQKGGPFRIESVNITQPNNNEVLVRVVATGMCHTDMVARDQIYPVPHPIVLGHEGAGIVEAVGENVTKVKKGDHVVLTFHSCGACRPCQEGHPAYCENFNNYNFAGARPDDGSHALCGHDQTLLNDRFFGQSSFGAYAIANDRNVVKVRKDAPLELLGPLGCGIQTGAGTALNALNVGPGASFAAFGAGAVGLSAVMAAAAVGATTIFAIDVVSSRLELAKQLGATHVVNSADDDPVEAIRAITGKGVDFAMDSTGITSVIRNAALALRPTGAAAIVGASKPGAVLDLDVNDLMQNVKSIRGVVEGDSVPDVFIPKLIDLYLAGRFPFDKLVKFYSFDQINEAAADSEKGITLKPIIRIGEI
ncbi:aryl-alcohol dehydrogenase [Nitrobacter sp. Nb-311A]|uniref:NAD(P)-dependent alcohol dehydrogenase n=1 Tax=unclassified Nitrobacter TaxID=2620411 RepID=UPI000068662F|nr:NAD(P)-dependent alcohol dehydrogenase [Nitrobacter sp.]EAQ33808.1 aryl-alcohol dehydrogenase [Nitrobacter sp. Nb-311A]MCV0387917.1 NAD(P)-dependent alcohol dehydrogenase [Nitrobacter sp.]